LPCNSFLMVARVLQVTLVVLSCYFLLASYSRCACALPSHCFHLAVCLHAGCFLLSLCSHSALCLQAALTMNAALMLLSLCAQLFTGLRNCGKLPVSRTIRSHEYRGSVNTYLGERTCPIYLRFQRLAATTYTSFQLFADHRSRGKGNSSSH
jgi:hypothetical protein